jgi:hypothetical protein
MQLAEAFEPEQQVPEFILPAGHSLKGIKLFLEDLGVEKWLAAALRGCAGLGLGLTFGTIPRLKIAWRRLVVPSTRHLGELQLTIQAAFNWRNCHLHEFHFGELRYGDPEVADDGGFDDDPGFFDESEVRLCDFGREHPAPFTYLYDFGGDWRHIVEIEALVTVDVAGTNQLASWYA